MKAEPIYFGFLPILKPAGPTSHDMVGKIRRLTPRKTKVGHTGTLDPFADGVMITALGKATRFADNVHLMSKSYHAHIELGRTTDTLDPTGEFGRTTQVPEFGESDLVRIRETLLGEQMQVPPAYSAKKVDGKRSYELARENRAVELPARPVTIHELKIDKIAPTTIDLEVLCSTGTYIRSLGRDIALALGTQGYLSKLTRTSVGPIRTDQCLAIEDLSKDNIPQNLIGVSQLLPEFPQREIPLKKALLLASGRPALVQDPFPSKFLAIAYDETGSTCFIFRCEFDPERHEIHSRMLCYQK